MFVEECTEATGGEKAILIKLESMEECGKTIKKPQQNGNAYGWDNASWLGQYEWDNASWWGQNESKKKWDVQYEWDNASWLGQNENREKWDVQYEWDNASWSGQNESGGGGWSTGNGTILVVSGLVNANISLDEIHTLANFLASNDSAYGHHIMRFFPSNSADMAFFQMDSEEAAQKAQRGLEGFKIGGRHTKKLHAALMPAGFFGTNSTMGNTETPIPWDSGLVINSPMKEMGNGICGRDSNSFGEDYGKDQSEMADNEAKQAQFKWNKVAAKEEDKDN